jgi:hypothetical protein
MGSVPPNGGCGVDLLSMPAGCKVLPIDSIMPMRLIAELASGQPIKRLFTMDLLESVT